MGLNLDVKVDGTESMKDNKSRKFLYTLLFTGAALFLIFLIVSREWVSKGKNVQSPIFSVTIPTNDSLKGREDSPRNNIIDKSKKVIVPDNHGKIIIKM
jgi:hypothetical protein